MRRNYIPPFFCFRACTRWRRLRILIIEFMEGLRMRVALGCLLALAVSALAYQASLIPSSSLIQPEELAKIVQARGEKPLILQVGSRVLFQQAHISGSEYVGAASTEAGQQSLKKRVEGLPKY